MAHRRRRRIHYRRRKIRCPPRDYRTGRFISRRSAKSRRRRKGR